MGISKNSSARYYQNNKAKLQGLTKNKVFQEGKKKKSNSMSVNDIKISLKMKKKN